MEQELDWQTTTKIIVIFLAGVLLIWTIIVPILCYQYLRDIIE